MKPLEKCLATVQCDEKLASLQKDTDWQPLLKYRRVDRQTVNG